MKLQKAQRQNVKLRIGLSSPSGFGKTYSALLLAYGLCGDWSKIAVIDTENNSAQLYSHLGEFNTIDLQPPYHPKRYIEAIKVCEDADIEVIIIDSVSHGWEGQGGCLELVANVTKNSRSQNSYIAWGEVTPLHQAFVQSFLHSSAHVITTVRRKVEYAMSKNEKGYTQIEKVGTKEVTKDGFEYELSLNLEIINDKHFVQSTKDRTGLFDGQEPFVITEETGKQLKDWAVTGIDSPFEQLSKAKNIEELDKVHAEFTEYHSNPKFNELAISKREGFNKELFNDELIYNMNEAIDQEELTRFYKNNPYLQNYAPFLELLTKKKEEILA